MAELGHDSIGAEELEQPEDFPQSFEVFIPFTDTLITEIFNLAYYAVPSTELTIILDQAIMQALPHQPNFTLACEYYGITAVVLNSDLEQRHAKIFFQRNDQDFKITFSIKDAKPLRLWKKGESS